MNSTELFFAFRGSELIARGPAEKVISAMRTAAAGVCEERLSLYVDETGAPTDIDPSRPLEESLEHLRQRFPSVALPSEGETSEAPRGRGRPKLGVVSREVSLLPRHWEWLATQRGGASATLRRLIDEERKRSAEKDFIRGRVEAAHRFMWDIAGNEPQFEESSRALFAHDFERFERLILAFPVDVQSVLLRYAGQARAAAG